MKILNKIVLTGLLVWVSCAGFAQDLLPYLNEKLSFHERVIDLLYRLTVEEKIVCFVLPHLAFRGWISQNIIMEMKLCME